MAACPICKASAKGRTENSSFPFCSSRCKTIDLGKWLNEEYRVPTSDAPEAEQDPPPATDSNMSH